jgi:hypothetical protein
MRTQFKFVVLIGLAGLGSACMSDEYRRADGLTDGAGNSLASNSVMQMVDPWQNGVQNTRLLVPAVRATADTSAADAAADAKQSQTSSSN